MKNEWEDSYRRLMVRINEVKKSNPNVGFYVWTKKWKTEPTSISFYNYTNSLIISMKKGAEISKSKKSSEYKIYSRSSMDMILLLKIASLWTLGYLSTEEKSKKCKEEIEIYLQSFEVNSEEKIFV